MVVPHVDWSVPLALNDFYIGSEYKRQGSPTKETGALPICREIDKPRNAPPNSFCSLITAQERRFDVGQGVVATGRRSKKIELFPVRLCIVIYMPLLNQVVDDGCGPDYGIIWLLL